MKLKLIGHTEKYAVEQSLLTLFPTERPVYEDFDRTAEARWAVITLCETADSVSVSTELGYDGKYGTGKYSYPLSGDDYAKEGQRRHAIGISFFHAAHEAGGIMPAWGSLTGVRPTKLAVQLLRSGGETYADAELRDRYRVSDTRRALVIETAKVGMRVADLLAPEDISLYVGIPFCPTRCAYCSFVAQSVERSFSLVEPYLAALFDEIERAGALVRELGLRVKTFYMGGGTPTTLQAAQMDRLLTKLRKHFDFDGLEELTIEAGRPDTIDREKLEVLRRHGTTRISINPQSMEDTVLRAIGRRHSADDIRRAMEQVQSVGFPHINMDLIAGLPEDTVDGFARSLREVLAMGADDITIHTLSLKKGSRILLEGRSIPSAEDVAAMLDYAAPLLRERGYAPYYLYRQKYMSGSFENVGWCLPNAEGLYNIYIMEELHSILSLGAGASTKMVGGGKIQRVFNAKYPQEYIDRPEKRQQNLTAFANFYRGET